MSKMYEALKKAQQEGVVLDKPVASPVIDIELPSPTRPKVAEHDISEAIEIEETPAEYEDENQSQDLRHAPVQLAADSVVIPWNITDSPGGEQYRIIRTRIVQHPQRPRLMAVSSAGRGDGKTISSINIAGVVSLRDNATVLLMDADFRRPSVSSVLGLPNEPGLADVLAGSCSLQDAILRVEQFPNLYILPAGTQDANPTELLDSDNWTKLCATVRERFSFVIVDGPPIATVADYDLIQERCDGVIMVVRPDHTDRTLFKRAFELIPEKKRLGVIVNCASQWFLWKTHESYYYGSRAK